jgi:3-oxoadipate enol-lactonase
MRVMIVKLLGMRKFGEILAKALFPKPDQDDLRKTMVTRWSANPKYAYLNSLKALANWSVKSRLPGIKCPTLVITAAQDYSPIELKKEYVALMPGARLVVIEDARHGLPLEKPEEYNRELRKVLDERRK